jgi:hypothetical protein
LTGSVTAVKTIELSRSQLLPRAPRRCRAGDDHCHLTAHQVGGEIRQPVVRFSDQRYLNQHIPTLGIADDFAQALSECGRQMCK